MRRYYSAIPPSQRLGAPGFPALEDGWCEKRGVHDPLVEDGPHVDAFGRYSGVEELCFE
jgi:hypothetical protein